MANHQLPAENTLVYLRMRCRKAGTSLRKIVDGLGINRGAIWRWKNADNIAVQRYRMIIEEIEKLESGDKK